MTENQINYLLNERERLMKAWRTAEGSDKMAILTRIEDIDDKLGASEKNPGNRKILPRRFFRR